MLETGTFSTCLEAFRIAEVTNCRALVPAFPNLPPATLRGILAIVSRRPELDSK